MMEPEKSEENTLKFIDLYRNRPILWNCAKATNKEQQKLKLVKFTEIAKTMNMTVEAVKKKIRSLRTLFGSEKRKLEMANAINKKYCPTNKWFFELLFLDSVYCRKNPEKEDEHKRKRKLKGAESSDGSSRSSNVTDKKKKNTNIKKPATSDKECPFMRRRVRQYMVQIPKSLLPIKTADVQALNQRYASLGIPPDFFLANIKWSDIITPKKPFSIKRPCQFHIMYDDMIDDPIKNSPPLEPADANRLFSAKVMLLSLPPINEIYRKCFDNSADKSHYGIHPWRLINFLFGVEEGGGTMAIGGPWSASLDGENPDKDPEVLIRTAIRTCKDLTGINLSTCTQWYRFVDIYYHRQDGQAQDDYVETVVIYLPDVHSLMPNTEEWQKLLQVYKNTENTDPDGMEKTPNKTTGKDEEIDGKNLNEKHTQNATQISQLDATKNGESSLPDSPHIIVRPNRQGKDGGKFDCVVKSMSVILDYHPDDVKEGSFEISLFTELFNDMLMRDFGFKIYKEISLLKQIEPTTNDSEITVENDDMLDEIEEEFIENNDETENSETLEYQVTEKNQAHNDSQAMNELDTSNHLDIDKTIINPQLLLSFIYFDTSQSGYIVSKDLEDLLYVLGLDLSRAKIRNIFKKLEIEDPFEPLQYRKLTHKAAESPDSEPCIEVVNMANWESAGATEDSSSEDSPPYVISSDDAASESDSTMPTNLSEKEIALALIDEYSKLPQQLNKTLIEIYNYKRKQKEKLYQTLTNNLNARLQSNLTVNLVKRKLTFVCNLYENEIEKRLSAGNAASHWLYEKLSFLEAAVEHKLKHKVSNAINLMKPLDDHLLYDLIDIYKNYKSLWDKNHLAFFDREKRDEIMLALREEIKTKINMSLDMKQLKRQLNHIHKSYSKDKRLRIECEINHKDFQPTFPCFYKCHFLESYVGPFKCTKCNLITETQCQHKKHKTEHGSTKCSECDKDYKIADPLKQHAKKPLKRKSRSSNFFCCRFCPGKFTSKEELELHIPSHKRSCTICGATFPYEKPFNNHMKWHEEKPKYFCHICQEGFFLKIGLTNHLKRHEDASDKMCDICEKTFSDYLNVYIHKERVHGIEFGKN